jgi:hypothetical protein
MPMQPAAEQAGFGRELLRERMMRGVNRTETVLDNDMARTESLKDRDLQLGLSEEDYRQGRERDDEEYQLANQREADRYHVDRGRGWDEDNERWFLTNARRGQLRDMVTTQARERLRERLSDRPEKRRVINA